LELLAKRQARAPKIYVRDSGLLHSLLGINTFAQLDAHPKSGASWEGFAIDVEVKRTTQPSITPSMQIALSDLKLTEMSVREALGAFWPHLKPLITPEEFGLAG
jgi:hypothetical protein